MEDFSKQCNLSCLDLVIFYICDRDANKKRLVSDEVKRSNITNTTGGLRVAISCLHVNLVVISVALAFVCMM